MANSTTLEIIGGEGGGPFSFTGQDNCASLEKISVWEGGSAITGIRVLLSDGREKPFGKQSGSLQEYQFSSGECFTSLSLWDNGEGTRLGAIKFETNMCGNFFAKMTGRDLKTEYKIDVGSGYCFGIEGRSGSEIDSMGFLFLNPVESAVITNVSYPTINQLIPKVAVEVLESFTYENKTPANQEYPINFSKKFTTTYFFGMLTNFIATESVKLKAGIPEVVRESEGFSITVGAEHTYYQMQTVEITKTFTTTVEVPPYKKVEVDICIGRRSFDLPYTGTGNITCKNGSVLKYEVNDKYKGANYSEIYLIDIHSDFTD